MSSEDGMAAFIKMAKNMDKRGEVSDSDSEDEAAVVAAVSAVVEVAAEAVSAVNILVDELELD